MFDANRKPTEEHKALERLIFRALVAALAVIGCILLLPFCWKMLSPFIISIPIAAMLQPLIRFLRNKCRMPNMLSVLLPVLLVIVIVCGIIYWFASFGFGRLNSLIASAPQMLAEAASAVRSGFEGLMSSLSIPTETENWLRNALNDLLSQLTIQGTVIGAQAVGLVTSMATGIPYAFIYLNFLLVGIYLVTKDYAGLRAKLPGGKAHDPNTNASQLTMTAVRGAFGYLRVQTTYAIISLVVGIIALELFGIPYAWLIAIIAAFLEFLPLFGNGTVYIPWSIAAYILGMPDIGTKVLLMYMGLVTFRRITEPKIMSANIGVSPLASLVGMFVGMRTGGLLGLMGGPIVMTVLGAVVKGHYLNGIRSDCRTLITYYRRRWDWGDHVPYTPPEELEKKDPRPERKAKSARRWKKG